MPARIVGMIGVTPPKQESTLLVIEGEISPPFVVEFAQAHEAAGFDMVLVGYSSSSAEGFLVAMHAAARGSARVGGSGRAGPRPAEFTGLRAVGLGAPADDPYAPPGDAGFS